MNWPGLFLWKEKNYPDTKITGLILSTMTSSFSLSNNLPSGIFEQIAHSVQQFRNFSFQSRTSKVLCDDYAILVQKKSGGYGIYVV